MSTSQEDNVAKADHEARRGSKKSQPATQLKQNLKKPSIGPPRLPITPPPFQFSRFFMKSDEPRGKRATTHEQRHLFGKAMDDGPRRNGHGSWSWAHGQKRARIIHMAVDILFPYVILSTAVSRRHTKTSKQPETIYSYSDGPNVALRPSEETSLTRNEMKHQVVTCIHPQISTGAHTVRLHARLQSTRTFQN